MTDLAEIIGSLAVADRVTFYRAIEHGPHPSAKCYFLPGKNNVEAPNLPGSYLVTCSCLTGLGFAVASILHEDPDDELLVEYQRQIAEEQAMRAA